MRGSKRKLGTEESVKFNSSGVNQLSSHNDHDVSSRYLESNRVRLAGGLPPPVCAIPSGNVEDYQWLVGSHHRDFDDLQLYKTTKIYTMRVQKVPYIVADRVWYNKGKYSGKGDCYGIHVRDIERYTRAYMQEVNAFLVSDHILSAQQVDELMDVSADGVCSDLRLSEPVLDVLLPAYLDRDALCQYMVDACVVVDRSGNEEVKIPTSHKNALRSIHSAKWISAESCELASLESKGVFVPTTLPRGKSVIDTRWVYALKYKMEK